MEWDKATLLAAEREMLGLYVSDHPLLGVEHLLRRAADSSVSALVNGADVPDGAVVTVGGLITHVQPKVTKKGERWAILTFEDLAASIEVRVFSAAYRAADTLLHPDSGVLIRGRLERRDEAVGLIAMDVTQPDLGQVDAGPVVITLPASRCVTPVVDRLKDVLATHPGVAEVRLRIEASERITEWKLPDGLRVAPGPALYGDLKALLGPSAVA